MGNSIPTVLLPGIVAILADSELVFLAMSSAKLIILETLTPAAGSNSFRETVSYYLLIFFILLFFLLSSNFKISHIFSFFTLMKKLFLSKKTNSVIQENILNESSIVENVKEPQVQEDLFAT